MIEKANLEVFAATLLDLAKKDKDIVVVTSDSRGSGKLTNFGKELPDQIIEAAKAQTPSGFELVLCESKMVEEERRVQVAQADYFMLYTVGFEDIDIAKKAKLMQILSAGYDRLNVPELAEAGIP